MRRYQRIIIGLSLILSLIFTCTPASSIEKEIENNPEPQPTATPIESIEIEEAEEPTPAIDVSEWKVTIGDIECSLEPFGNEYPGWYMADCPEQLWFPIGQTTKIELDFLDSGTCTIRPIGDFEIAIQDLSIDAMPVEFVKIEEGGWGCQIPYSDIAGSEVVCGFECGGEEIKVIILGKTIRVNSGGSSSGNGNNAGNGGNQSVPPPPPPPPDPINE